MRLHQKEDIASWSDEKSPTKENPRRSIRRHTITPSDLRSPGKTREVRGSFNTAHSQRGEICRFAFSAEGTPKLRTSGNKESICWQSTVSSFGKEIPTGNTFGIKVDKHKERAVGTFKRLLDNEAWSAKNRNTSEISVKD